MEHDEIYGLLLLSKELVGHPHLRYLKIVTDQALVDADVEAKVAAEKMVVDRKAKVDAEAAAKAKAAEIAAKAVPAHQRLDDEKSRADQVEADKKIVAEADKAEQDRLAQEEAARKEQDKNVAEAVAPTPVVPAAPVSAPSSSFAGRRVDPTFPEPVDE
jgi:hypothetical protein